MIVTIKNAQFRVCCDQRVYVKISDEALKMIRKSYSGSIGVEMYNGFCLMLTSIDPSNMRKFIGAEVRFNVECDSDRGIYILKVVEYKPDYENELKKRLNNELKKRLNDERYEEAKAKIREYERRNSMFGIKNVIHHDPATIVYWCDGTKTVVKCGKNDIYDPEKGFAMAIAKKVFGNKGNYYNQFKKWLPEEEEEEEEEAIGSDDPDEQTIENIKKSSDMIKENPIESENTWGF